MVALMLSRTGCRSWMRVQVGGATALVDGGLWVMEAVGAERARVLSPETGRMQGVRGVMRWVMWS